MFCKTAGRCYGLRRFADLTPPQTPPSGGLNILQMLMQITYQHGDKELAMDISQQVEKLLNPGLLRPSRPVMPENDSAQTIELEN